MTDALSATFSALADPTRRSILARLAEGEATVNELAAPFPMSLPSVSRHLKVLESAGLVSKGRSAQWRPCRLEVAQLRTADAWMAPYRRFFESSFDRLEVHLQQMVAHRVRRSAIPTGPVEDSKKQAMPPARQRKPARQEKPPARHKAAGPTTQDPAIQEETTMADVIDLKWTFTLTRLLAPPASSSSRRGRTRSTCSGSSATSRLRVNRSSSTCASAASGSSR